MNLQDMITAVNRRVDDVLIQADGIEWLNEAKNHMAVAVNANFPDVSTVTGTFAFDAKWHHLPVLFTCARFKEKEVDLQEAQNFMVQFEQGLKDFVMKYEVPAAYRDDHITQQFVAPSTFKTFTITKSTFNPSQGDLKIYVNGRETTDFSVLSDSDTQQSYVATSLGQTFTISNTKTYNVNYSTVYVYINGERTTDFTKSLYTVTCPSVQINDSVLIKWDGSFYCPGVVLNDTVTAVWEDHTDLVEPPYSFWRW